ncbi:pseudouridine-5'-phosphate glycosidase [Azospirillum fermentarium]|uniref:pseudouridine-5'-phosphate glycosidase n=1 Tax=Azospirillum fermentarium TaxID=1233114 RepID=UPI002225FA9F|nr:pseudouridine-5'-phosphate glycosidase [Azospirillum fermentarium]MCW2246798.1 pseudouridine-5'-phosphate glycosidase [Azospirillum fermentarium]
MHDFLSITPAVADAIQRRRPVVALESTIISHGMPYPENIATAQRVEAVVSAAGAVPATIAVLDGRIRIGLTAEDLERLARGPHVAKLSRRDLPVALATGGIGATTVATTMIAARMAGIPVFATGGIGGVHRGAESSFDISADLEELARTDVCVVCSGAKSILDLPKTLEYLETRGVPVLGFGTADFPAFYTRTSGLSVDHRCGTAEEVARIMAVKWRMGLGGGVLLANPVPEDSAAAPGAIATAIATALDEAGRRNVQGKDVTPFLLARVTELTGGDSLKANIALICDNARVAAAVAAAYSQQQAGPGLPPKPAAPKGQPPRPRL